MDLTRVSRRIAGFRSRIRGLFAISGLSRLALGLMALLLLSFVLDYFLKLPLPVRYASFAIAVIVLGLLAQKMLIRPLRRRLSDDDLAIAMESRLPELEDRLISALQFQRQVDDPENAESKAMMHAVIEDAGRMESAIRMRRVIDSGRVRREALAACGALAAFAVLLFFLPSVATTWARRNLLLADIPWPRSTTLLVEGRTEGEPIVITRGETLRVDVRAEGKVPDDVEIWFARTEGEDRTENRRKMFQVEDRREMFRFEFRQVPASFEFWVVGGDDTDGEPVFEVKALIAPTLQSIRAHCEYPAYTGMPAETLSEADLEVPRGTRIRLDFTANMPLSTATLNIEGGESRLLALGADGTTFSADLIADETISCDLALVGAEGQRNLPDSAKFRIRAVQDRKPDAKVLYPTTRPWQTPAALVPFKLLASDNFGITRVSLFHRKGAEGDFAERVLAGNDLYFLAGGREVVAYVAIPLADLTASQENPVQVGDEIHYYCEVEDNNGNVDRTDGYRISVVSEEALQGRLSQLQRKLRVEVLKIRTEEQEPAERSTREILAFLAGAPGALEAGDRERLRDIQVRQGTVTRRTDRFLSEVIDVLNTFVYNRLTNPLATERILALFDEFLRADHENLSRVFKHEVYRALIEEYRAGEILDQQALAVLIEIIEISLKISEDSSPAAHRILSGLTRAEPSAAMAEELGKVHDIQMDILADFRLLDRKMSDWETYAEIISIIREIKATEERIKNGADALKDRVR